jgi:glutaconyl-CoA/methylmalonyl-CoA decarboxylase subunit gamma
VPLPGQVIRITANVGDAVKAGEEIMVIEAMKMEQPIVAPADGVVKSIDVSVGDTLSDGQVVAHI